MSPYALTILLLALNKALSGVLAVAPTCPLLGTSFPPAADLGSQSRIQAATANLTNAINQALSSGNTPHGPFENNQTTFSVQIFSTHSLQPVFDFHHTAPLLENSTSGTKHVNADSVYRVGSISKLFSVYTFLAEDGDKTWIEPVTKYVPELKEAQKQHRGDPIDFVQWDDVTVGALASQLAGIGRDYVFGDFLLDSGGVDLTQLGFPQLNASDIFPCTILENCTRGETLRGFSDSRPVFAPFTTPIYSNIAFQILSYAFEGITNKTLASVMVEKLFEGLNMTSSNWTLPADDSNGVIPVNDTASGWNQDLGEEWPAGSIYSSVNDLSKLGRAILQSTLLLPAQTRRWMKPHTHTAQHSMSVGAPWEIFRYINPAENRLIDVYTKGGDIGVYSSIIALIPEYDLGFSVLGASPVPAAANVDVQLVSEMIADILFPELENVGRDEASQRFAGTYTDDSTNSTLTLSTKDGLPGLHVDTWRSKGVDVSQSLAFLGGSTPNLVLYPTNLFNNTVYAWRADIEFEPPTPDNGTFSWNCLYNWVGVDGARYGARSIDDFLFELGEDGKATSVQPRALRTTLTKTS